MRASSDLGLIGNGAISVGRLLEDTHPVSGEMWGNFPQTCSMVGIINDAVQLSAAWETGI